MVFQRADGTPLAGLGKLAVTLAQEHDYFYQGAAYRLILNALPYAHISMLKQTAR